MLPSQIQVQRLTLALKGAKCGMWDWNLVAGELYFDCNYFLIAGYEPDEFPHHYDEWKKRVHPDDIVTAEKAIQQYIAGNIATFAIEFRFKTKRGTWMWIQAMGEIGAWDKDNNPARFIGLHIDITERKQAEIALKNASKEWRLIMDEFGDIIYLLDNDRHLMRANTAFYSALETTPEHAIGRHITELIHTKEPSNCPICLAQQQKCDFTMIMEADDDNNSMGKPFEIKSKIVRNDRGAARGIMVSMHDLTQARLREQKLRDSEHKFHLFADYSYGWEYWLDPQGDYRYISPSCERITGYRPDEFVANNQLLFEITRPEYAAMVRQHYIDENRAEASSVSMEFSITTKAGKECWLEHHCIPVLDVNGKYAGRRGTNQDITARKQAAQQQLELEAQLHQKNKVEAIGIMAGGIAHNFNNNLSIILGNIELSQMQLPPVCEIGEHLSNAKIAVLRSRDLIQQILTYSHKVVSNQPSMPLADVIDETMRLLEATIPATVNLQLRINGTSGDLIVTAASSQVQECLVNLCNNASYAMEEKGDLTITLDSVELHKIDTLTRYDCQPGRYAKLSVHDTGSGMTADTIDKIFDLFYTTKPVDKGTGVGLATVQGIVYNSGGMIKVNSRIGEGSTFELYFPVAVVAPTQVVETAAIKDDMPTGTELILFVDDDPLVARLNEQLLKVYGYTVSTMTDSTEALKLFSANADRFDLVITDQTMPGLTGQELITKIKAIRADIPTIICTGFSSKIDQTKATALGASAFLMKPIDIQQLLQTVRRVLDSAHS